jgi:hypothetical protein
MNNNSTHSHGSTLVPGVIVSEMVAPVRFRRKVLAVAGAFVVASAAAACSAGTSAQTPSPAESPEPTPVAATTSASSPTASPTSSPTAVQKVNANYKKFDPKNFGEPIGDLNKWFPVLRH